MAAFAEQSRLARRYSHFFATIPVGRRVLLVEQNTGLAIFDWLQAPANLEAFEAALAPMKSLRLPGSKQAFLDFLRDWPAYREQLDEIRRRCRLMQEAIAADAGPGGVRARLQQAAADGTADAYLADHLRRLGYVVEANDIPAIVDGIAYQADYDWAIGYLNHPAIRRGWNRQFNETFGPTKALADCTDHPDRVDWIADTLAREGAADGFDRERFLVTARNVSRHQAMLEADRHLRARYGEAGGSNTQTYWLVFVSFLVCVVGIANAMLMSVLERFKEIATMKCLGARNETIAFLFINESLFMGIIGGSIGIVAGSLIALIRQSISYGALVYERFPVADVLIGAAICFGCSILLTAFASVYPARVAARMPPMEAMRID